VRWMVVLPFDEVRYMRVLLFLSVVSYLVMQFASSGGVLGPGKRLVYIPGLPLLCSYY
jgi:hypothetical protein